MLNFRRKPAPASRVEPKAGKPSPAATSNADKARALIAMLENGGDGASVPPERLRDWARDLVETVERRPDGSTSPQTKIADVPSTGKPACSVRLFSTAAPVLSDPASIVAKEATAPKVAPPQPAAPPVPLAQQPAAVTIASATSAYRPSGGGRLNLSAPIPHAIEPAARNSVPTPSPAYGIADIRKIVDGTVDPRTLACEHPTIIAMTLAGKPSLEQAAALRRLPTGQVRAVHRALRQIEVASA